MNSQHNPLIQAKEEEKVEDYRYHATISSENSAYFALSSLSSGGYACHPCYSTFHAGYA
jgi:hypothetical protein